MSSTGYVIWFIATTVMTVAVMGLGVAGAAGVFAKEARTRRRAVRDERRRLAVPRPRSQDSPRPSRSAAVRQTHDAPS